MIGWTTIETESGQRALLCDALAGSGLAHLFTLRPAGGAKPSRDIPEDLLPGVGLSGVPIARPRQVHGAVVATRSPDGAETSPREADAVAVPRGSGAAAIATADCVGAILHDPDSGAFAVVHAGWRGTIAGVVPAAIRALSLRSGARPERMVMAMGPSIRGCCYEVGEEVAGEFERLLRGGGAPGVFGARGGRTTIDLVAANRELAARSGVEPGRMAAVDLCTSCRTDLCWSYRKAGAGAGRMWTLAGSLR